MNDIYNYISEKLKLDKDIKIHKEYHSSHIDKNNYAKFLSNNNLGENLKDSYCKKYKTDDYGNQLPNITFAEALAKFFTDTENFEEDICFNDSIVRERIWDMLSKLCEVPYDDFYIYWLKNN